MQPAWCRFLTSVLVVIHPAAGPLLAQSQTAVLTGVVRSESTGSPLTGAEVVVEALQRRTTSDAAGRFVLAGLSPGIRHVVVRAVGYHPTGVTIELVPGDTTHTDVRLDPMAVELPPIVVTERSGRPGGLGREAFEERRRLGFGRFIDSTMLRRADHLRLTDVLRRHGGGIEIQAGKALNGRYRDKDGKLNCYLQIVLDGLLLAPGGPP